MAITSRAARTTDLGSGSTPAVVGPGSYLKVEREMPVHGYAPFSSTAERTLGVKAEAPDAKVRHPGPGQYDLKRTGHISNGKRAAGSAFSSKVARMAGTSDSSLPGPGQYTLPSQFAGSSRGGAASAREARRGVAYLRVPSAPSVPAREQSYGYEETHTGELVLQKPPAGGYSGVSGRLSAGPGSYDPTKAASVTKPQSKAVAWGNSRVQRSVFLQGADTPGPGAYNGRPPPAESSDPATAARSARPSAAFASRVPLASQLAHDPDRAMPGPASYSPMVGLQPKSMPENLQTFGSTQKRLASDAVTTTERQRMAQPGPGAYNTAGTFGKRRAEKGPPQSAPGAPGLSPFNTSEQRFKPLVKEGKPGPGQYDQLDQYTFVAQLQRKTHGRNGVFGSTTRRFHTLKQDPIPGAGAYNPVPVSATQQSDEPTSSFASGQERFAKTAPATLSGKAPKDPVPPPWHYVIKTDNMWDRRGSSSRKANQIFGSTATRFAEGASAGGGPGPGPQSYAPRYPNEGFRKQQTTAECFGTKQARFGAAAGLAAHTPSPGPGDYESGIDSVNPLVKRSFNITVS